jgi:probable HAF family extracellular repeat protein
LRRLRGLIAGSTLGAALLLTGSVQGAHLTSSAPTRNTTYQVTNLPSLGGSSTGSSINNRGWVAGVSHLPGDQVQHAALWRGDSILDLDALGGPERNSGVLWPVKNERGIISGISQTAQPDPLGERWSCSAFFPAATGTGYQCLGFVWQDGVMRPLPTLGGTNGFATGTNNKGQTVGWAENTVHDPTCVAPQVLQFRAVVWGPKEGQIRELPPLPGDTVSAATALNDRGQVVGISGICDRSVGRFSAIHAVLWEDGKVIDIGNLGGVAWNTPMSINEGGDVVGFSNTSAAAGGGFAAHAFLWTRSDGIRDLGTLPGDTTSQALGINGRREIVGTSCDADFNCRAFLWRDGVMTDLNTLVIPDYHDTLTTANDINESGRITGQALEQAGTLVAFVARR